MRTSKILLALSASFIAMAPQAVAQVAPQVTVSFTESATDNESANPAPSVQGWQNFFASGGNPATASLFLFFAQAPDPFTFTYSLLEPNGDGEISDQITFTGGAGEGVARQTLTIRFLSDPADFVGTVYGSTEETGASQPIPLPNLPPSGNILSVFAQSDLDVPEPATWMMMLLGFGVTGFTLRRGRPFRTPFLQPV